MFTEQARRQTLRQLLTSCRSRLAPEVLLPGPRAAGRGGLTQEETARLLGISPRRYGSLERGDLTHPAAKLMAIAAERLHMTPEERVLFHLSASGHLPPQPGDPRPTLPFTVKKSFLRATEPHPTLITDHAWNVLAYNTPVTDWFTDPRQLPPEERNIILWLFSEGAAARLVDIADERRSAIARLRTTCIRARGDTALEELVKRLIGIPAAAQLWKSQSARISPVIHMRRMRHPTHGTICSVPGITAALPGGQYLALHLTPSLSDAPPGNEVLGHRRPQ